MQQRQTLSVLVENRPGVLARVSGMFHRRRFTIASLAVGAVVAIALTGRHAAQEAAVTSPATAESFS